MAEIVYLTGAPAAGKSTTARLIAARDPTIEVFEFGDRLTAYLAQTSSGLIQEDLRRESATIVTPAALAAVEAQLFNLADSCRGQRHLIVDSHPVTKECYGFRITPYSFSDFARLHPTQIWLLYASPEVTRERISADPRGRPLVTAEEAAMHTHLSAGVAAGYAMSVGLPVYIFDTGLSNAGSMADLLARRLGLP